MSDFSDYSTQNKGTPKVVHILIPRTCDYVSLYSKKDFANVMKLKILRWEEYLNYLDRPAIITGSLKEEDRKIRVREEDVMPE